MNGEDLQYFSLQGEFSLHPIVNGQPGPGRFVGECSSIEYGATPTIEKFKENTTGLRGIGMVMDQGTEGELTVTMHNVNTDQLELILGGDIEAQSTTAVVDAPLVTTPAVGQRLLLGAFNVSSVVIKDSTPGTPLVLTPDVNYRVDVKTGTVDIIDLTTGGPFVGALTYSLTPGALNYIKLLTNTQREFWARFNGINTEAKPTKSRMVFEWYRFQASPSSIQMINESRGEVVLTGTLLADATKPGDGPFGPFGRAAIID